jgi:hypothetical protein
MPFAAPFNNDNRPFANAINPFPAHSIASVNTFTSFRLLFFSFAARPGTSGRNPAAFLNTTIAYRPIMDAITCISAANGGTMTAAAGPTTAIVHSDHCIIESLFPPPGGDFYPLQAVIMPPHLPWFFG